MALSKILPASQETIPVGKNLIINGAMQVAQRGTTFNNISQASYSLDRWKVFTGTISTVNITQQSADSTLPNSDYYLRAERSAGTNVWDVVQYLEGNALQPLRGNTAILSFKMRKGSGLTSDMSVTLRTTTTEGGSTAVDTTTSTITNATLTSSWQSFTVSLAVPAGSAAAGMYVAFSAGSQAGGANVYYEIAEVQLEVGNTATPFEHRSYGDELTRCQRYYAKTYNDGVAPATATSAGAVFHSLDATQSYAKATWDFPVTMRANPSIVVYNDNNGTSGQVSGDSNNYTGSAAYIGNNRAIAGVSGVSLGTSTYLRFHATMDAEL